MVRLSSQKRHLRAIMERRRQRSRQEEPENDDSVIETSSIVDIPPVQLPPPIRSPPVRSPPRLCVFSTLVSGGTFNKMQSFCANMGIKYVAKCTFYRIQKEIGEVIKSLARESMMKHRNLLQPGSVVCADGRYPTRRNSSHCTVDIIDIETGKVVALGIVDKASNFHPDESFNDTSNMMETEALRRALAQFQTFVNLTSIVIDGDNKNKGVIEEYSKSIKILRDPNHTKISFEKYFTKETNKWKNMDPDTNDCFNGTREKVKRWYVNLLYMDISIEQKKFQWNNVVDHLLGNHENCLPHEETMYVWNEGVEHPKISEKLREILKKREDDFDNVAPGCATQQSEAFHRIQLIFGNKALRFPVSQQIRDYLAVLLQNEEETFLDEIRDRLKLKEYVEKHGVILQNKIEERIKKRAKRRTAEYKKYKAKSIREKLKSNKKRMIGDYKNEDANLGSLFN